MSEGRFHCSESNLEDGGGRARNDEVADWLAGWLASCWM